MVERNGPGRLGPILERVNGPSRYRLDLAWKGRGLLPVLSSRYLVVRRRRRHLHLFWFSLASGDVVHARGPADEDAEAGEGPCQSRTHMAQGHGRVSALFSYLHSLRCCARLLLFVPRLR
jgi:hypothetical protein